MKNEKNTNKKTQAVFVGVDVSKDTLDTYVNISDTHSQYGNDSSGMKKLIADLKKLKPTLVIFEATGDYDHHLMMALGKAGIPFHQVNPRWTRHYAISRCKLVKTDKVDAKILAEFAAERSPKPHETPTQTEVELHERLKWHRQLTVQKAKLKTQLLQAKSKFVEQDIRDMLDACEQKLVTLEAAIDELLEDDPEAQRRREIVESVPGIGPKTARTLLVEFRELGEFNSAQIASMAGVAPMNNDSGRYRGQRHIQGGRGIVRTAVYKGIVVSVTRGYNPVLHAYYTRLIAAGKPFKVAMIACVRKLLIILNAMIRNNTKWR